MAKRLIYYLAPEAKLIRTKKHRMHFGYLYSYLVEYMGCEFWVDENHLVKNKEANCFMIEERYFDENGFEPTGPAMLKDGTVTDLAEKRAAMAEEVEKLVEFYGGPFDVTSATANQRRYAQGWADTENGEISVSRNSILAREAGAWPPSLLDQKLSLPRGFSKYFFTAKEEHHVNRGGLMVVHLCMYKAAELLQTDKLKEILKKYKSLLRKYA